MEKKFSGGKNKFKLDDVPEKTRILILFVVLAFLGAVIILAWLAGFYNFLRRQSQSEDVDGIKEIFAGGLNEADEFQDFLLELKQAMPKTEVIDSFDQNNVDMTANGNNEGEEFFSKQQDDGQLMPTSDLDRNSIEKLKEKLEKQDY